MFILSKQLAGNALFRFKAEIKDSDEVLQPE
jgi:hypothetical protein